MSPAQNTASGRDNLTDCSWFTLRSRRYFFRSKLPYWSWFCQTEGVILFRYPQTLPLKIGIPNITGVMNGRGAYSLGLATPSKHPVIDHAQIIQCHEAPFVLGGQYPKSCATMRYLNFLFIRHSNSAENDGFRSAKSSRVHGVRKSIVQHATNDSSCVVVIANRLVEKFGEYSTRVKIH